MQTEIQFQGLSTRPNDIDAPDGTLSLATDLINDTGALQPLLPPKPLFTLPADYQVLYIHKGPGASFTNYILLSPAGTLQYLPAPAESSGSCVAQARGLSSLTVPRTAASGQPLSPIELSGSDSQSESLQSAPGVSALGNTLIILLPDSIRFFLWRDNTYASLGSHLPEVPISFGLVGHPRLLTRSYKLPEPIWIKLPEKPDDFFSPLSDENSRVVTDSVMANLNKFIAREATDNGRFCLPFLIRYALRLYDGSLVMHSAPVLLNPATTDAPAILLTETKSNSGGAGISYDILICPADIDFRPILSDSDREVIDAWKDIITSVDIFVSAPIFTYDPNQKIRRLDQFTDPASNPAFRSAFIGRLYSTGEDDTDDQPLAPIYNKDFLQRYAAYTYSDIFRIYFSHDPARHPHGHTISGRIPLAFTDSDDASANAREINTPAAVATFRLLKSYSLEEISTFSKSSARKIIDIPSDYLRALNAREAMTDEYLSHDSFSARLAHPYNARLNLADITRRLFRGFSPAAIFPYTDSYITGLTILPSGELAVNSRPALIPTRIDVYIKEGNYTHLVQSPVAEVGPFFTPGSQSGLIGPQSFASGQAPAWFYYPNPAATVAVIQAGQYNPTTGAFYIPTPANDPDNLHGSLAIRLHHHDFLNGAYAYLPANAPRSGHNIYFGQDVPEIPPVTAPAGQNGIIPAPSKLYTSEPENPFLFPATGINTIGTGRIRGISSAAKALSQGQFGQFPLYAFTDEGVWALEVSATGAFSAKQPITRDVCTNPDAITQIDSAVLFPTDRGLMIIAGSQTECLSEPLDDPFPDYAALPRLHQIIPSALCPVIPFREFLREARIVYNYIQQHFIIFRPDLPYAYIYSRRTRLWSLRGSTLLAPLNAYPSALAVACAAEYPSPTIPPTSASGQEVAVVDLAASDATSVKAFLLTRPIKLQDPHTLKTIYTALLRGILPVRGLQIANISIALYGTRDYINWHLIGATRGPSLRSIAGTPYKAFRLAAAITLTPAHAISGIALEYNPRFTRRLH